MMEIVLYGLLVVILLVCFVVFFGAPYVPTLQKDILAISKIYKFETKDVMVDIGCGGGRVLRAIAPNIKRAIGYELSPITWLVAKILCRKHTNVIVKLANFWYHDLPPDTTVVYTFLASHYMPKLSVILQAHANIHQKPVYLISNGFGFTNKKPIKTSRSMKLFLFEPLQA